jgi:CII-binding regulator of phage lambda lysogenization HflD
MDALNDYVQKCTQNRTQNRTAITISLSSFFSAKKPRLTETYATHFKACDIGAKTLKNELQRVFQKKKKENPLKTVKANAFYSISYININ